ncbi:MAG: cupredoxin domain-containing protein [Solirubrobacterales bacterium]|nr:cupredoxin domain-containing protein [Solirubrobacterales bacterium]
MRKYGLTFAVVAALSVGALSAGTAAASVLAASHTASSGAGSVGTSSSARSTKKKAAKKRAAKKKALRKCNKKRQTKRRKACRRTVSRRFSPKRVIEPDRPVKPTAPVATIDVLDDYYSPNVVTIKSGESILWVWSDLNHDPHEVNLIDGPAGVKRDEFRTASAPAAQFTFTRTFTVPGTYHFACSLHVNMRMTVEVE